MSVKQKGFSLIELLVSMLIVSIAMLGFAALQAHSARALSGTFARTSETAIFNDFIKLFQVSNRALISLNWNDNNTINFDCTSGTDQLKYKNNSDLSVLADGVDVLCDKVDNASGIIAHDIAFRLTRTPTTVQTLNSYSLRISYAYIPKQAGVKDDQTPDESVNVTVARYCPLDGDEVSDVDDGLNTDRIRDRVVCSRVEVML
ncbi:prepilin-type N-terminal cleavage/methylation domain-containing protein [Ruminobacter sp.]|uniref:prepilin-type N-terminal cleavage/methylation domain-containing protein n=1 Tax=Ruminobacter sp. TaxID=2774296 RepID=UPI00386A462B